MLSPVEIVDKDTGVPIPYNDLQFVFERVDDQNIVRLVIDYDGSHIQDTFVRFSIDTSNTSLPSIQSLPPKPQSFARLDSEQSVVPLYSYSEDLYQFQKTLDALSMALGYVCLAFVFAGLLAPAGKLIVIEALAVVQITFFSVLQFQKIPPTFLSFRHLLLSNGYNQLSLF